ncbi:MAG: hypothetical protein ABMA64_39330, partial [Myxococcota bacterium]
RESVERGAAAAGRLQLHHARCADVVERQVGVGSWHRLGMHLLGAEEFDRAIDPLQSGMWDLYLSGEYGLGSQVFDALQRALHAAAAPDADERWGEGWLTYVSLLVARGDYAQADGWTERALRAARAHGWVQLEARALVHQAVQRRSRGDLDGAEASARLAQPIADEHGSLELQARVLRALALVAVSRRDPVAAALSDEARARYELGGHWVEARDAAIERINIAITDLNPDRAESYLADARRLAARSRTRAVDGYLLLVEGEIARLRGEHGRAVEWTIRAEEQLERAGHQLVIAARVARGLIWVELGEVDPARPLLESVLADRRHRRLNAMAAHLGLAVCAIGDVRFDAHWAAVRALHLPSWIDPQFAAVAAVGAARAQELGSDERSAALRGFAEAQRAGLGPRAG